MAYSPQTWVNADPITAVALNRIETGIDDAVAAFDAYVADDTGWLTTGLSSTANWQLGSYNYRRINGVVWFNVPITRKNAAISVGTNGNITDSPTITLPVDFRPSVAWGATTGNSQRTATFLVATTGLVSLTAVGAAVDIEIEDTFYIVGSFPI